jgi:hypothetical protein
MQASKIKVNEQYHVDSGVINIPYGVYDNGNAHLKPTALKVIEKGIVRPGYVRADGVRVEIPVEQYDPIMQYINERVQRQDSPERKMAMRDQLRRAYPRQWVISSRKVAESVEGRKKRVEIEQMQKLEAEAWREYEMREKVGAITLAKVGEMIDKAEREVKNAAQKYRRSLATWQRRIADEEAEWEQATEGEGYMMELVEGADWPEVSYYTDRAWTDLKEARATYKTAQKRYAKWMEMANGD